MDTQSLTEEYRLSEWSRMVRERNESGLSIKAYCASIGLPENTYFYRQRKVKEAAAKTLSLEIKNSLKSNKTDDVPSGWAICREENQIEPINTTPILIEIGKCRITVTTDADQNTLYQVCRTLCKINEENHSTSVALC